MRRVLTVVVALVVVGFVAAPLRAQAASPPPDWKQLSPASSPSSRYYIRNMMAYDAASGQLILFGGLTTGGPSNQTWDWNGTTWTLLSPATSPPAREGASLAYDPTLKKLVLFGGYGPPTMQDTWTWDGTTWTQVTTTPTTGTPPSRTGAMLAYDTTHQQLVLFGGSANIFGGYLSDTWIFDGSNWAQVTTSVSGTPSARWAAGVANDAASGQLIIFGGEGSGGDTNDTWAWTGTEWSQLSPTTPPSTRYGPSLAYDPALAEIVLFGGNHNGSVNDTWTWNGTNWTQLTTATSPPPRDTGTLGYDGATDQLILFGGETLSVSPQVVLGDTWTLLANVPTKTAVTGTPNPLVAPGQATYTATVTVPSGGATPNGGTLAFTQDGTPIPGCGAVALANGAGQCQVSYSATQVGNHNIEATYSGDTSYLTSTSDPWVEAVIIPVPPTGAGGAGGALLLILGGAATTFGASRRRRSTN